MIEHFFNCPYCGAEISVLLEQIPPQQDYIEDCEVCCNPMLVSFKWEGDQLLFFEASSIEQ